MKRFLAIALAVLLTAVGAPVMAAATGGGDSGGGSDESPTKYERAVDLIEVADYEAAVRILEKVNRKESGNADVLNMLGYAHRKLGRMETALGFYQEALAIEPRHLGANEYLGELYLETGKLDLAEERLAELAAACPSGCEEREELAEAIDAYKSEHGLE